MSNDNQDENRNEDVAPEISEQTSSVPETAETAGVSDKHDVEDETAVLKTQIAELTDQYLRKAADFENFRKRMNREKLEAIDFANQSLLIDIIQIIDDFERAIKSAEVSKDFSSFHEGISMIEKRLISMLENKWALVRFDSLGEVFDPNRHEAIYMEKSADVTEPTVSEDCIKGYTLKERVIRTAKVKVIMPAD